MLLLCFLLFWLVGWFVCLDLGFFACSFSKERERRHRQGVEWMRGMEDLGGDEGEETVIRIQYIKLFSIKAKKKQAYRKLTRNSEAVGIPGSEEDRLLGYPWGE